MNVILERKPKKSRVKKICKNCKYYDDMNYESVEECMDCKRNFYLVDNFTRGKKI